MRGLKDKVVLVTGGAGGIGAATCKRFGEEGAAVAVVDINLGAAQTVANEIVAAGGKAQAFAVDLTNQEQVIAGVAAVEAALGPIGVLVNNAGWDKVPRLSSRPKKHCGSKLIAINLYGSLYMLHAVLQGHGRAQVPVASSTWPRMRHACWLHPAKPSMHCLQGRHDCIQQNHGARTCSRQAASTVNVVCPGPTDTALFADCCRSERAKAATN
jgi:2-hydroxycyclohexanecarboxyl-CoA dehydrogenase